jgi:hypothetical protein
MVLWFAVLSAVIVAEVFRSPMVDYRLVAAGSLLPLLDLAFGRATVLHTLAAPVIVLTAVMLVTMGRRLRRRRLLAIPIGHLLHLVLDASWDNAELFWWPAFGWSLESEAVPETGLVPLRFALELVAVPVAVWAYRRYGLDRTENRRRLLAQGHLDRAYLRP